MSRRPTIILGLVGIALVLVAMQVVAPVNATGCGRAVPADLQSDDGGWLLIRASGCTEGVYSYDRDWQNETVVGIGQQANATYGYRDFSVVSAAPDGGWWFVSRRGRAYRFSEGFQYQNQTLTLPVDTFAYLTGVEIDGEGRWWVMTHEKTTVYNPVENETIQTFRGATDLVIRDQRVWFLTNGYKGGHVHEYAIRERGGRPTLRKQASHELGPEVFNPTVLARGPDGQWVVYSKYERAFVYDQQWRYTGEQYPSDSGGGGVFFLLPAFFVSVVGFWLLSWRVMMDQLPRRLLVIYTGSAPLAATLAVSLRESLVPPSLSFVYWPPDLFIATLLVLPTAFGGYLLKRRSLSRVLLLAVANLPLLVVAWDFLTSAG